MPKLFVAVDLPGSATSNLVAVQPPAAPGIRLTAPGQMHLTLHYIGEVNEDQGGKIAMALGLVDAPAISFTIEGVGQFPSKDGATTLWAGIGASAELLGLHGAVGRALAEVGVQAEARRYTPHIALARCNPEVPESLIGEFLTRHQSLRLSGLVVSRFGLYSSFFQDDVPVYQCAKIFPLQAGG